MFNLYYYIKYKMLSWVTKKDPSVIPRGDYCYTIKAIDYKTGKISINPCTYYKTITQEYTVCLFLGYYGDDDCFADQCKICNVNNDMPAEEDIA